MLAHQEIRALIIALGAGLGDEFDCSKLRYNRVFIMTDADVDGSHIRTLLLTFFFRHMPELITGGNLYIAQPPLYRIQQGSQVSYAYTEGEQQAITKKLEGKRGVGMQRYKGLGEMNPDQLWETTLDPQKRTLLKVQIEDEMLLDETFVRLMGEKVEPRRDYIQSNAKKVINLDI